jgi:hypothetical protein
MVDFAMATAEGEKELMRQWVENWKVVGEETERLKRVALQALTEEEGAEQFNGMDCDPALIWRPEERIASSGLVEQQRLFSKIHEHP